MTNKRIWRKRKGHMKLTDLRNAVNEIDFDMDKQEQMILEI